MADWLSDLKIRQGQARLHRHTITVSLSAPASIKPKTGQTDTTADWGTFSKIVKVFPHQHWWLLVNTHPIILYLILADTYTYHNKALRYPLYLFTYLTHSMRPCYKSKKVHGFSIFSNMILKDFHLTLVVHAARRSVRGYPMIMMMVSGVCV